MLAAGFHPGTGAAIDVGAAPGGWTAELARNMRLVVAVDPADLDPQVLGLRNVVHIKRKSEDAVEEITTAIGDQGVDLVVCDANKHPEQLVMMCGPLLEMLRPGGLVVFTLKFRGRGRDKKLWSDVLLKNLHGMDFYNIRQLWLLANTVHERTIVAMKR